MTPKRIGGFLIFEQVGHIKTFNEIISKIPPNQKVSVEVRRGDNASMEIAVVRKMIAIIREHVSADFVWESPRLHRIVTLSARMGDNAGLEDFMMLEFFSNYRSRY